MNTTYIEPEGFKGSKGEFRLQKCPDGTLTEIWCNDQIIADFPFRLSPKTPATVPMLEEQAVNAALLVNAKELLKAAQILYQELRASTISHFKDQLQISYEKAAELTDREMMCLIEAKRIINASLGIQ